MTKYKLEVTVESKINYSDMVRNLTNMLAEMQRMRSVEKVKRLRVIEKT